MPNPIVTNGNAQGGQQPIQIPAGVEAILVPYSPQWWAAQAMQAIAPQFGVEFEPTRAPGAQFIEEHAEELIGGAERTATTAIVVAVAGGTVVILGLGLAGLALYKWG